MSDPILADSFRLSEPSAEITTLALVSLKAALRAYFSTYSSIRLYWSLLTSDDDRYMEELDQVYRRSSYYEDYVEAIIHFHHFVELSCLDLLRREHPLLTTSRSNDHVNLWRSVRNTAADWDAVEQRDTINFETALWRLWTLITQINFGEGSLHFFDEQQRDFLVKLRDQRDHLLHRGTIILRYRSFDIFIGQYVLPFIHNVLLLPNYANKEDLWRHKTVVCKGKSGDIIDPISSILTTFQTGFELGSIALFKEIGRAAYQNPIPQEWQLRGFGSTLYRNFQPRAEKHAVAVALEYNAWEVRNCPVCGAKTLLVYGETETEGEDPLAPEKIWHFTTTVECTCCSFSIDRGLKNLQEYGITEDDYWYVKE